MARIRACVFFSCFLTATAYQDSSVEANDSLTLLQTRASIIDTSEGPGPRADQIATGSVIFVNFLATVVGFQTVPFEAIQKKTFPEVASDNGGEYLHNDELKSYSTLMLAYSSNVYWWKNGADAHEFDGSSTKAMQKPENTNFFPSFGAGYGEHWCSGNDAPSSYDNDPAFSYSSTADEVQAGDLKEGTHDTQASIYSLTRDDETIITLAFRGSETPHLDGFLKAPFSTDTLAKFAHSMDEVVKDWFGSDFNFAPMDDAICNNPDVQLHNGVARAYLAVRSNVQNGLRERIRQAVAERAGDGNPIKIFVTGHSLGAALAQIATYDLWCNKNTALKVDGVQYELFGSITFGPMFVFWKKASIEAFMKVVPVTKRIRVAACASTYEGSLPNTVPPKSVNVEDICKPCGPPPGNEWHQVVQRIAHAACTVTYDVCVKMHGAATKIAKHIAPNEFVTCDLVGGVATGLGPLGAFLPDDGYFHALDNDFQVAWVSSVAYWEAGPIQIGKDCYGPINSGLCHLLERYSQGMRRFSHFNTGGRCEPISSYDPNNKLKLLPESGEDPVVSSAVGAVATADWWGAFDHKGWANTEGGFTALYRNDCSQLSCIEEVKYAKFPITDCYVANWWNSFDSKGWSACNDGYFVTGLNRNECDGLGCIEEAKCCRANGATSYPGSCHKANWWSDFDKKGWSSCPDGTAMAGFFRNDCEGLECIEEVKCCPYGA